MDLYRILDGSDDLLYIGISFNAAARAANHKRDRPWWHEARTIKIEKLPDRETALAVEKAAIKAERPRYNKIHNRGGRRPSTVAGRSGWTFASLRSGYERTEDLWLHPELNCSPCVDDVWDESGEDQLDYYVSYLRKNDPDAWERDAVSIYWTVMPAYETAPFTHAERHFLNSFTWPERDGEPLDWFQLPVRHSRFPEFGKALGWTPGALQSHAPIRSIMASKRGGL